MKESVSGNTFCTTKLNSNISVTTYSYRICRKVGDNEFVYGFCFLVHV
jgi:hypothetical protein